MNDHVKAIALGECELTLEGYHCKEFLTILFLVFRKFMGYQINFKRLKLVRKKNNISQQNSKATDIKMIQCKIICCR